MPETAYVGAERDFLCHFSLARGGRGAHGPAPVGASLHRLRRQTALRGTVSPSSVGMVGGTGEPRSAAQWRGGAFPASRPQGAPSLHGRNGHSRQSPMSGGPERLFLPARNEISTWAGREGHSRRRGMSFQRGGVGSSFRSSRQSPPQARAGGVRLRRTRPEGEGSMVLRRTVRGEAVERSADRRRTLDPSPISTKRRSR